MLRYVIPHFYASLEEAAAGTLRKLKNLNPKKVGAPILNFSGQPDELCCKRGEVKFITDMIYESKKFATSCFWFTTLVAKQSHLKPIYQALKRSEVVESKTIQMGQGNKTSRIVAWTFLSQEKQKTWARTRWG